MVVFINNTVGNEQWPTVFGVLKPDTDEYFAKSEHLTCDDDLNM